MRRVLWVSLVGFLGLATACREEERSVAPPSTQAQERMVHATRSSQSVLGNLDRSIAMREGRIERGQGTALDRPALVDLLHTRGSYFGRPRDLLRSLHHAEADAKLHPRRAAWLRLARARAGLHDWAGARDALDLAIEAGADSGETRAVEAELALAAGDVERAIQLRAAEADERPSSSAFANLAVALATAGAMRDADQAFVRAEQAFAESTPLPIAWVWFQHGRALEQAGAPRHAASLYRRALSRLPEYSACATHLAAILEADGDLEGARSVLERAVDHDADGLVDPAARGLLGRLLIRSGQEAEGAAAIARARADFAELVRLHPAAFVGHAAELELALGELGDPDRAMALADELLRHGASAAHHELALRATARAQGHPADRCARADAAGAALHPSPALELARAQAYLACGRRTDADAAMTRASVQPELRVERPAR